MESSKWHLHILLLLCNAAFCPFVIADAPTPVSCTVTDIDQDDDGLIEICDLEGLNAIRYTMDGTGYKTSNTATTISAGCDDDAGGTGICRGYELVRNLDFDDDGSYRNLSNKTTWTENNGWQPIGYVDGENNLAFTGIFEGNNYTISNLFINTPNSPAGLFYETGNDAEIKNIGLAGGDISGSEVGSLVHSNRGLIVNSYVTGNIRGTSHIGGLVSVNSGSITGSYTDINIQRSINNSTHIGGLAALNQGTIVNSLTHGTVFGRNCNSVGGLVGENTYLIINSYANTNVEGNQNVGGLVGLNTGNSSITDSYASGSVLGGSKLGGLVGAIENNSPTTIRSVANSYAIANITGTSNTGGLIGAVEGPIDITDSYWNKDTSGQTTSAGGNSGTTVALQSPIKPGADSTRIYFNWSTDDWDFGDTQNYPILKYTAGPDRDACGTTPETTLPRCANLLLKQRSTGLATVFLLIQDKVQDNNLIFNKSFSSLINDYYLTIPYTTEIRLNPYAVDNSSATITIKKQGDETNYFASKGSGEISSLIPITATVTTLTVVVTDDLATTYTLVINRLAALISGEITVAPVAMSSINDDGTVNEGNTIILATEVGNGHRYTWSQTPMGSLDVLEQSTSTLSVFIPEDFVNANAATSNVIFTLTVEDAFFAVSRSKTVTINKIDNGSSDVMLEISNASLQVVRTGNDPDGTREFNYQFQALELDNENWIDVATGTSYAVPVGLPVNIRYRVRLTYTDNQGYTASKLSEILRTDIDDDDNGLIDIYYLEDLDAMRYSLDGSGYAESADATKIGRGCPADVCSGYELRRSLDFTVAENYLDATANRDNWTVDDYTTSTDVGWLPIGNSEADAFTSVFKGNNHKIANLQINRDAEHHIALFGFISDTSEIRDVGLANVRIEGLGNVASLVAESRGKIINSYASVGSVTADMDSVGGLAAIINGGNNNSGIVVNSYANIGVESNGGAAGGLIGRATSSTSIVNSFSSGDVRSPCEAGGLVAQHLDNSRIVNSYARAIVGSNGELEECNNRLGGLVATNDSGTIQNSYAASTVSSDHINAENDSIGGLAAFNTGTITASYWDSTVSPNADNGYGSSRTTVALQTPVVPGTTLTDVYYGWDSSDWDFGDAQSYPALRYTADNVNACDLDPNIAIPPCSSLLPAQRNYGLNALFLLSDNEVLDNNIVFGDTPFSSAVFNYDLIVASEVDAIRLNPYAINPDTAIITIKRYGDNTDTNYFADKRSGKLSESILLNEIETTLTIVVTDLAATTYTLAINKLDPLVATINADDTANEGDILPLVAQVQGGSGNYRYEWTQIPPNPTLLSQPNIAVTNARIPENLIEQNASTRSVTFTVTVADGFSTTSQSTTVIINKIDNGSADATPLLDGSELSVTVEKDPDGDGTPSDYQWQARDIGNSQWVNITSVSVYTIPRDKPANIRYRVRVTYTDNQGYTTSKLSETIRTDIDDDDDGLIDIYYLEDLDAMRYRLDGSGYTASADAAKLVRGCRADVCSGYELRRSLDFEIAENYLDATANRDNWTVDDYTTSTDVGWLPIGNNEADAFTGTFKGNNFTIANLQINRDLAHHIALFGFISDTSEIRDIGLANVRIEGLGNVASLVAESRGKIINSYASDGSVTARTNSVGGLAAIINGGTDNSGIVVNSYANIGVESNGGVAGGLVGRATSSTSIVNSFASGDVGSPCEAGGLVAQHLDNSRIVNSYARGIVESNGEFGVCNNRIGGLVAINDSGTIQNSYAASTVSSDHADTENDSIGGLVAFNTGTIIASYWDNTVNSDADNGYGSSRTTVALQTPVVAGTTLTNVYYGWDSADWDFGDAQSYPALRYTAGNVDACGLYPNIAIPPCSSLLPAQRNYGLSALFLLSDNEVLDNNIVFGDTPFSSAVFNYDLIVASDVDVIRLNPYAINPNTATITIKKRADNTDTNYFAGKYSGELSESILLNEIATTIGIVVKDSAITTYTLAVNKLDPIVIRINTDDTANEGDTLSLAAEVEGGSGNYRYEWMQIPAQPTLLSDPNIAVANARIPENLIERNATTRRFTFVVSVGDDFSTTSQSTTVIINKIDNGSADVTPISDGSELSVSVENDPDGNAIPSDYQWQARDIGNSQWVNITTVSVYMIPRDKPANIRYRVRVTYTDNQGYTTSKLSEAIRTDIDDDDDGLIDVYYLEDLNAIRYRLDGSGYTASADATKLIRGCRADVCSGYELRRSLDFEIAENYLDATANRDNWTVDDYTTSTDVGWSPIGNSAADAFTSVFKGNNHKIANLQINRDAEHSIALFGFISDTSEIRDIGLSDVHIEGLGNVASLVAESRGTIINSYANVGSVTANTNNVGGLAAIINGGNNNSGIVVNSYANVNVESNGGAAGGLVGRAASSASIVNSFASGEVGSPCEAGGLVAQHLDNSRIVNSYARSVVESNGELEECNNRIGGLVATNDSGTIQNSYAASTVSSDHADTENDSIGGLVARNTGTITASYWDSTINPDADNGYGSSRTTVALQTPVVAGTAPTDVYYGWDSADWDFGDTQSYPALRYTAGNVDACGLDPNIAIPPCRGLLPAQRNNGLSALFLLSDNEVLDNNTAFGDTPFSSSVFNYDVTVASDVDAIQLNPYAINPNTATITIKKRADNTDTNYFADKHSGELSESILLNEIATTIGIVVRDTAATTYTLAINRLDPILIRINADDTANEGDTLSLAAQVQGGSGNYRYEWTQIPPQPTLLSDPNIAVATARIPENLIEQSATTLSVTFTVTIGDGFSTTSRSKTVTINKIDNGSTDIMLEVSTEALQVMLVGTDPDGANEFNYQWQARAVGNANWMDVSTATRYVVPADMPVSTRYRMQMTYTDNQGYTTSKLSEILRTNIDDDDDGLIDIYYLEDLDAMRYGLDGSGYTTSTDAIKLVRGCRANICSGYELRRSLDFEIAENYLDATANRDNWTVDDYTTSADVGWLPIGNSAAAAFTSVFNGNNYKIANLQINRDSAHHIALFGFISDASEIRDIGLADMRIEGQGNVGSLVAESRGKIINSYATAGSVTANIDSVGGLAATIRGDENNNGTVINSYANIGVESNEGAAGALVGRAMSDADIVNSFASGDVRSSCEAGGLVAQHLDNSRIVNSYASGVVESNGELGGCNNLIGGLVATNDNGIIQNSYAAGTVSSIHINTGNDSIGGLVARNTGTIIASYWDSTISPDADNGYGSSRTTVALQTPVVAGTTPTDVYYDWDSADWDFGDTQSYPTVRYTAGNADACGLYPNIAIPPCRGLLPAQRNTGLSALFLLSNNETLDNNTVFGDTPFSSAIFNYDVTVAPEVDAIQLNPYAINPNTATITIKKHGDNTDTNYFADKRSGELSESILLNEINTTLTIAVRDSVTATYTLAINKLKPPVVAINADDTANEGDTLPLVAEVQGGSGNYRYEWTQIPASPALLSAPNIATPNARIPEDLIERNATTLSVTFTVSIGDGFSETSQSKTVIINKIDNGSTDIMLEVSTEALQVMLVGTDPDGANEFNYQWQAREVGNANWTDVSTATSYTVPTDMPVSTRYRMQMTYTDNQGYTTSKLSEILRTDIDDDDDGLIDIYYLEDLDAMRYRLDGSGYTASADATRLIRGCRADICSGYELRRSLDFEIAENYLDATANRDNWTVDDYTSGSDVGWLPIGNSKADAFTSVFKGNNFMIANLQINRDLAHHIALFGFISDTSEIREIGLSGVHIEGLGNVASLVAESRGKIINSYANGGSVTADMDSVGGLAAITNGDNNNSVIVVNSYANVGVESNGGAAGGLVGRAISGASIVNSFALGEVRSSCEAGGLVAQHIGNSRIVNSYAHGVVESNGELVGCNNLIGGLVATNDNGTIQNSYVTGTVSSDHIDTDNDSIGGLVARNTGTITASYWDSTVNPDADNGYGSSRTTVALQTPVVPGTTPTDVYYGWDSADWDFGDTQSYPTVRYATGNVDACGSYPNTKIPPCRGLLPAQRNNGLSALFLLSNNETLDNDITFGDTPFSSVVFNYDLTVVSEVDAIQLNPYAINPNTATITIKKHGDNTDTNYFADKRSGELSESISLNEINTTLTVVVKDSAATTYTLAINKLKPLVATINADDTANEGDTLAIVAQVEGGSGNYRYEWTQMPTHPTLLSDANIAAPNARIPENLIA